MAREDGESPKTKIWYFKKCPKCGMNVHMGRRHCACHAYVWDEPACQQESAERPKMWGKANLNLPYFTCNECCNCAYCASFAVNSRNKEGWGGLDCKHRNNSDIRCRCCEIQIKCFIKDNPEASITEALRRIEQVISRRGGGYEHKTA
jgi:hypothetical protein